MKAKLSYWLIAALCVTAILVSSTTVWAQEATEGKEADAAEKQDTEADPFAIPEGDAEELAAFIMKLQQMRPRSREEYMDLVKKQPPALNEAATKLLALEPSEKHAMLAVQIKSSALSRMAMMGKPDAAKELTEFLAKMKKDDRKAVSNIAVSFDLQVRASKWRQMEDAEKNGLINELLAVLGSEKPGMSQLQLVRSVVQPIERSGDTKRAGEVYTAVIPLFRTSDNPRVATYADKFEGTVRRINLVGNTMEVKGTLLDGTELDWKAYRGKVVLVDYWATWCGPCVAELPNVVKNYELYHDKGFDVIGISLDTSREKVEKFVKDQEIPWPIVYSDEEGANGWNHPMATYYGITGIPTAILVDQDGNGVTLRARGPELGKQLEALLGKPEGTSDSEAKDEVSNDS